MWQDGIIIITIVIIIIIIIIIIIVISWLLPQLHLHHGKSQSDAGQFGSRAATTAAWAGSGWTGASAGPCDLAVASPFRSVRQTSACRCASSGGRRKCCSHFPLYAPWTCSSGCISPAIRGTSTQRLTWGGSVWPPGCWTRRAAFQHPASHSIKCVVAVKYIPGVCTWLLQFYEFSCTNKVETIQHTRKTHGDLLEVNMQREEVKGPLSGHQCNWHKWSSTTGQQHVNFEQRSCQLPLHRGRARMSRLFPAALSFFVKFTSNYHACVFRGFVAWKSSQTWLSWSRSHNLE